MQIITDIPQSVMQLSPDYELVVPHKTDQELGMPDVEGLNKQQRVAFNLMDEYVSAKEPGYAAILFEGFAGTGKTHTLAQLIKKTILMYHKKIAITAPTNKAVKVIKQATGYTHNLLTFKTLHALMGLKPDNDDKGKEYFVSDPLTPSEIESVGVLIIDESSMLPDELFLGNNTMNGILHYMQRGLKVIFVGDPLQIPPVNKPDSIPFNEKHRQEYDIYRVALTEVVRQAEGNPILELATLTRLHIQEPQIPYQYYTRISGQGGIVMINRTDKPKLYELCDHYFSNARFKLNSDFVKVIAWTNKTVDFMNDKIRRMLYKNDVVYSTDYPQGRLNKIMVGEKLIADKPIIVKKNDAFGGERGEIVFTTNDEFQVLSFELQEVNIFGNYNVAVYHTTVEAVDEKGKRKVQIIDILHERSEAQYEQILKMLMNNAKNELNPSERKRSGAPSLWYVISWHR
jgi:ATP-dependent exoDNAse (exonuclease V) alpha subunit